MYLIVGPICWNIWGKYPHEYFSGTFWHDNQYKRRREDDGVVEIWEDGHYVGEEWVDGAWVESETTLWAGFTWQHVSVKVNFD